MEKAEKIGAWTNKTKTGKQVINFTIDGKKYVMYVNDFKKEEKHPDYQIVENTYKPKAEAKMEYATPVNQQESEDDLPF